MHQMVSHAERVHWGSMRGKGAHAPGLVSASSIVAAPHGFPLSVSSLGQHPSSVAFSLSASAAACVEEEEERVTSRKSPITLIGVAR